MLFVVRFVDKQENPNLREENLSAHIDWLDTHRKTILVGGSLRTSPDERPVGALWIVDAPNTQSVEALFKSDPFWSVGLRESYEIHYWSKAFEDRKTPV